MTQTVLAIGGSDSSAGAGIQADLKAIAANGGYAATVITVVTAQNSTGVTDVFQVPPSLITAQLEAVFSGMRVDAIKSGVAGSPESIAAIAEAIAHHHGLPYVLDPVLSASSGANFERGDAVEAMKRLLFPLATLVTPNATEATTLSGIEVLDVDSARRAGAAILASGCQAVLIKGGHLQRDRGTDVIVTREGAEVLSGNWLAGVEARGTGCTLASTIATHLAAGAGLPYAVRAAKTYVARALAHPLELGQGGPGSLDHFAGHAAGPSNDIPPVEVNA